MSNLIFDIETLFYLFIDFLVFIIILMILAFAIKTIAIWFCAFLERKENIKRLKIQNQYLNSIDGLYPIHYEDTRNLNYNQLVDSYLNSKKTYPNVPSTLHYAPSIKQERMLLEDKETNGVKIGFDIPTYNDILNKHLIGNGDYLIGFKPDGEQIRLTKDDFFSLAIGGQSGTGKTNTMLWLLKQAKLNGAEIIIIDPHNNNNFLEIADTIANTDEEIISICDKIIAIGEKRLLKPNKKYKPIAIGIDEVIALLNYSKASDKVKELLDKAANQYRKVNIAILASSQDWKATRLLGDNSIRTQFTNRLAHRMEKRQGKLLIDSDENNMIPHLGEGQAIFSDRFGNTNLIEIPFVTEVKMITDKQNKSKED